MKEVKKVILRNNNLEIILYIVFILLCNIFMFTGYDFMKFDIFNSHYPNSMFLSNSLKNGILPLWNPLFNYGSPHYANIGMPTYYPTTVFFAFLGYRLWMMAAEYSFHLFIACWGMNRYIFYTFSDCNDKVIRRGIALFTGLLYGFSGNFVGNAQHIMIVISAAWIPYIFLDIKKYMVSGNKKYLVYAACYTGLSIQGGYPEVWVMTLIIVIPFMIFYVPDKSFIIKIKKFLVNYMGYGILVFFSSSIIVIPTLKLMPYMSRLNGQGKLIVSSYEWKYFVTTLFPRWGFYLNNWTIDVSMMSMYVGIFTILLIPSFLFSKWNKEKFFITTISAFIVLMMMGENGIIHPLFQRYVPIFNTFRFPSSYRCLLAFFLLHLLSSVWLQIFIKQISHYGVMILSFVVGAGIYLTSGMWLEKLLKNDFLQSSKEMITYGYIFGFIVISVAIAILIFYLDLINTKKCVALVCGLIFVEVFLVYKIESPITIGYLDINEDFFTNIRNVKEQYDWYYEKGNNREQTVDYKNSIRGNGYETGNSQDIIISSELSEIGYTQVKLDVINNYRNTANRYIIQGNPVFYFTNDVVTRKDVSLDEWLHTWGINEQQIYIEDSNIVQRKKKEKEFGQYIEKKEIDIVWQGNRAIVTGEFNNLKSSCNNTKWKLYIKDQEVLGKNIELIFYKENGETIPIKMKISEILNENGRNFFYGVFPTYDIYSRIDFLLGDIEQGGLGFEYSEYKNRTVDDNISIHEFTPNRVSLKVLAEHEGYLVNLQTYYPGWYVRVDGERRGIVQVNNTFRGVYLEEGIHEIEFVFIPLDFYIGAIITGMFYLVLVLIKIKDNKYIKNKINNVRELMGT